MQRQKIFSYGLMALIAICLPSIVSASKIYKWVDKNGVTQFTNTSPPLDKNIEAKQIKKSSTITNAGSLKDRVKGVWFVTHDGKNIEFSLTDEGFSISDRSNPSNEKYLSSGEWELNGKKLTLIYKYQNYKKSKKGTTENFYILEASNIQLVLLREVDEKRFVYRADSNLLSANKAKSRLAKMILGSWTGIGRKQTLKFYNEKVAIYGNVKNYSGLYRSYIYS